MVAFIIGKPNDKYLLIENDDGESCDKFTCKLDDDVLPEDIKLIKTKAVYNDYGDRREGYDLTIEVKGEKFKFEKRGKDWESCNEGRYTTEVKNYLNDQPKIIRSYYGISTKLKRLGFDIDYNLDDLETLVMRHARLIKILENKESLVLAEKIDVKDEEISNLNKEVNTLKNERKSLDNILGSRNDQLTKLMNDNLKLKEELDILKIERENYIEKVLGEMRKFLTKI